MPGKVRAATGDYRDESDPMGDFLRSWVITGEPAKGRSVAAGRLYLAYEAWCTDSMVSPLSQHRFGRKMGDRGFHKEKIGTHAERRGRGGGRGARAGAGGKGQGAGLSRRRSERSMKVQKEAKPQQWLWTFGPSGPFSRRDSCACARVCV